MQSIQLNNRTRNAGIKLVWFVALGFLIWFPAGAQVQELYLMGIARSEQGEYHDARLHFEKALSYNRDNPDCLLKLAEACCADLRKLSTI